MCRCSVLPHHWWPEGSSEKEVVLLDWIRLAQIAYGWTDLWVCSFCNQKWQGIIAPGIAKSGETRTECISKYFGDPDEWEFESNRDLDHWDEVNMLGKKALQGKRDIVNGGYQPAYYNLYSPWGEKVKWKSVLTSNIGDRVVHAVSLLLARDGEVHYSIDPDTLENIRTGHTKLFRLW